MDACRRLGVNCKVIPQCKAHISLDGACMLNGKIRQSCDQACVVWTVTLLFLQFSSDDPVDQTAFISKIFTEMFAVFA
jgi:hypothetical protein